MRRKLEKAEEMKRRRRSTEDLVGRSDRDTVEDRWREQPPLLPAKPPE